MLHRGRETNLRDLSCRLRCSLRLKARLQNWHLYFFSGAAPVLRAVAGDDVADASVMSAEGIWTGAGRVYNDLGRSSEDCLAGRARVWVKL